MKKVIDNWLFLSNQNEFKLSVISPFWERLSMFLAKNIGLCPSPILTNSEKKWIKYYGQKNNGTPRAFYDEYTSKILFWSPRYEIEIIKPPEHLIQYSKENGFKYAVPLTDVYHEMVHHVQYTLGDWLYDDLLEASAEISIFIISGEQMIDYIQESVSLWYVGRKMLKLKPWEFYIFIRDCIVEKDFYYTYFYNNSHFIKLLGNDYSGSIEKFLIKMKNNLGNKKWENTMKQDLNKIHNTIFYRW